MRRLLLIACLVVPAPAWAIVPPVPRVAPGLLPPGDDKPVEPKPDAPPAAADDNPLKTIERITQTAKAVGDRLKETDTGEDTRKQQDQLLRDIDSLLKQNENPPPQGGGGGGGGGGGPPPPPMGGGGGGGSPPPMGGGGGGGGGSGRKQRGSGGQGQQQQPMGGAGQQQQQPMGDGGKQDKPMPAGGAADPNSKESGGGGGTPQTAGAQGGKGGGKMTPDLPLDDPFSKRVWGHLPEKLRQQAMQSYREQFMPQYSELLKQYYSNIAEREKGTPRK